MSDKDQIQFHTDKVFEENVFYSSTASVALDHVHLVGRPGIDVAISDVADVGICAQGAHSTSTTPVAVDTFNKNVGGR